MDRLEKLERGWEEKGKDGGEGEEGVKMKERLEKLDRIMEEQQIRKGEREKSRLEERIREFERSMELKKKG